MSYASISIEGGIFPPDLLDRLANAELPGQSASDFGLDGRRIMTELQAAFSAMRTYWDGFEQRRQHSRESVTTLTRQAWIEPVFELLGFKLEPQRAGLIAGNESFVISHTAGAEPFAPPVHVVALDRSLDHRDGRRSPHSSVQEYLNRCEALWGIVTNGAKLRLLRDSSRVSHPVYLEFDLRAMAEGNLYSEFVVLYRLLHASRLPKSGEDASTCLLETYYQLGIEEGGRVREHLRDGVEEALQRLGTAFLAHPANEELRGLFKRGRPDEARYYRELLRLIYRLLFLAVAEERRLLFPGDSPPASQAIYDRYYSLAALRNRADSGAGRDSHIDLWEGLRQTFRLFRDDSLAQKLGLHALNGELFGEEACREIESAKCTNADLLAAIHSLSMFEDKKAKVWRRVNYAALDVEELGSVYESLLDFQPKVLRDPWRFEFISGTDRKTTGSYYTPPELVHELIQSALVPVIEDRLAGKRTKDEKEAALLGMRVIDPASGSGHFVLAAARRIARELARARSGEDEPSPAEYRHALRDVIRACIYAVDRNPLATDLCKVALWIEGHNAGSPLSFLDNHVKCGDSLVGVFDLDVLRAGIPDDAYTAVSGDEKTVANALKKQNQKERLGQLPLGFDAGLPAKELASDFETFAGMEERTPADVHAKEEIYQQIRGSGSKWWQWKVACDLWTAAFFTPMTRETQALVPTTAAVWGHLANPKASHGLLIGEAVQQSGENRFFHWPLEFPEVFANGGFDVVLGNPPWEQLQPEEVKFFASVGAFEIAGLSGEARKRAIARLPKDSAVSIGWERHKRTIESGNTFIRGSARFPLTARGKLNTYAVFAELARSMIGDRGRSGLIVPSGIATDDSTKVFFGEIVSARSLVSLYDFENRLFPEVHKSYKFCLLTTAGRERPQQAGDFAFFLHYPHELAEAGRRFSLSPEDFALLNPNTLTCPIFRTARDAEITKAIYRRVPVLIKEGPAEENPWQVSFRQGLFNMTSDSGLFQYREDLEEEGWRLQGNVFVKPGVEHRYLPLYEAKMVHQFDHRWASYTDPDDCSDVTLAEKQDPAFAALPRYWVDEREVEAKLAGRWDRGWLLGWRDICRSTDERTVIAGAIPRVAVGHTMPLFLFGTPGAEMSTGLIGNLASFAFDFVSRQKIGGTHLTYTYLNQLPVLPPSTFVEPARWDAGFKLRN